MRLITNQNSTREEFEQRLRFITEPVPRVSDKLRQVALDLVGLMYSRNAIGLAANQVGLKIKLCVLDPAWMRGVRLPIVMFNPEIVECGEELYSSPEGCLSLPEIGLKVPRFRKIKVRFLGINGKENLIEDDNSLLSSVLQHEIDHLNGIIMIDRVLEPIEIAYKEIILKGA